MSQAAPGFQPSPNIEPELVILLERNIDGLRMIVTWPRVWTSCAKLIRPEEGSFRSSDAFREAWSTLSGVDIDDIDRQIPILFDNELLLPDGA